MIGLYVVFHQSKYLRKIFIRTQDIQHFVLDILASAISSIMDGLPCNLHRLKSYM